MHNYCNGISIYSNPVSVAAYNADRNRTKLDESGLFGTTVDGSETFGNCSSPDVKYTYYLTYV